MDLPNVPPAPSSLVVEDVVTVSARAGPVEFVVASDEPLPVEVLEVHSAEGEVVAIEESGEGVRVAIALSEVPYPRWVPVAIRDRRRDEQPAWVAVRVKARPGSRCAPSRAPSCG